MKDLILALAVSATLLAAIWNDPDFHGLQGLRGAIDNRGADAALAIDNRGPEAALAIDNRGAEAALAIVDGAR